MEKFKCSICGTNFKDEITAKLCEQNNKITKQTIIDIGDCVKIKTGEGAGELVKITKKIIFDIEWGNYAWKRYWHTEGLIVEFENGGGRILTFDDYYEDIKKLRSTKLKKII